MVLTHKNDDFIHIHNKAILLKAMDLRWDACQINILFFAHKFPFMDMFFNCSKNGGVFLFGYHLKSKIWLKSWKVQFPVAEIPIIWSSTSEKLWVHKVRSKNEPKMSQKKAILPWAKTSYMRKTVSHWVSIFSACSFAHW